MPSPGHPLRRGALYGLAAAALFGASAPLAKLLLNDARAHRDKVNAKVMKDPRLTNVDPSTMPFDMKRMLVGGFKVIVDA